LSFDFTDLLSGSVYLAINGKSSAETILQLELYSPLSTYNACYRQVLPEQRVLVHKISFTEKPINRTRQQQRWEAATNENWLSARFHDNRDWHTVIQGQ